MKFADNTGPNQLVHLCRLSRPLLSAYIINGYCSMSTNRKCPSQTAWLLVLALLGIGLNFTVDHQFCKTD